MAMPQTTREFCASHGRPASLPRIAGHTHGPCHSLGSLLHILLFKIHYTNSSASASRFPHDSLTLSCFSPNFSVYFTWRHKIHPSHTLWYNRTNERGWRIQIRELKLCNFIHFPIILSFLWTNILHALFIIPCTLLRAENKLQNSLWIRKTN